MFRAILSDPSVLRDSLDAVSGLITEGTFEIDSNGIKLVAMDPASVSLVIFKLLSTAFVDYKIDTPKRIAINIEQFVQILKRSSITDQIFLELDEEKNRLNITMKGNATRKFSLPLLDDSHHEKRDEKHFTFPCAIEVEAGVFKQGVKDASMIADSVILEVDNNNFSMIGKGDINSTNLHLNSESPSLVSIEHDKPVKSKYSIEYLEKMIKAAKVADSLIIRFGTNHPLQMEYKTLDKLMLTFILAPRVEED